MDDEGFDAASFYRCPTTNAVVDPDFFVPNKTILQATKNFIEENPWAFDFDPRQKFKDIKVLP